MPRYIALLRAVNVGGTGKLPMADLKSICLDAGFTRVETYIASGNVVFESKGATSKVAAEMAAVLKANPFPKTEPKITYAIFLDQRPPRDALDHTTGQTDEEMRLGAREIFVHYPSGMGRSKLRIPVAKAGTTRNMNTVAKLAEMATKP